MASTPAAEHRAPPQPLFDLEHLHRQTSGDEELQRDVLTLFLAQLRSLAGRMRDLASPERADEMHRLKGAARAVGAFAVAEKADRLERQGGSAVLLRDLEAAAERTSAAIEAHLASGVSQR